MLDVYIDKYFDKMVEDIRRLIAINSVCDEDHAIEGAPFGPAIREALNCALDCGRKHNFQTRDLDGYVGIISMGEPEAETVGVLGHVDIVPAGNGWNYPPFAGIIDNNKLYGRGVEDDKGPMIACLYAMLAIRESGLPFTKKAHLIFGTDEETGSRCIKHYLRKEGQFSCGFSPDAMFPIVNAEKGIARFSWVKRLNKKSKHILNIHSGTKVNMVPNQAEIILAVQYRDAVAQAYKKYTTKDEIVITYEDDHIHIIAKGIQVHAMKPEEGRNALQILLTFISTIPLVEDDLSIALAYLYKTFGMDINGAKVGLSICGDVSGPLTLNMGILSINEQILSVKFDIRYPVTANWDTLRSILKDKAEQGGFDFMLNQHKPPLFADSDLPYIKQLSQAYEECTGAKAEFLSMGGGTYCRFVENAVSFGPVFPGEPMRCHQSDECFDLDQLRLCAKIYAQALYRLIR